MRTESSPTSRPERNQSNKISSTGRFAKASSSAVNASLSGCVAAGGLKQSAPCVADRIAEGAHAKAWMALAISKTGDPNLMIW
jgi:hypothetical protein